MKRVPPAGYRELCPPISGVKIQFREYARRRKGITPAREAGLRYEERVQWALASRFADYQPEPHVMYWTGKGPRNAFPDGLMLFPERTVVFEMKRQHMPEAWWQLRRHYQPVLEAYRPQPVQLVEVVREFDLGLQFPEPIKLLHSLDELDTFTREPIDEIGVLLWKL